MRLASNDCLSAVPSLSLIPPRIELEGATAGQFASPQQSVQSDCYSSDGYQRWPYQRWPSLNGRASGPIDADGGPPCRCTTAGRPRKYSSSRGTTDIADGEENATSGSTTGGGRLLFGTATDCRQVDPPRRSVRRYNMHLKPPVSLKARTHTRKHRFPMLLNNFASLTWRRPSTPEQDARRLTPVIKGTLAHLIDVRSGTCKLAGSLSSELQGDHDAVLSLKERRFRRRALRNAGSRFYVRSRGTPCQTRPARRRRRRAAP